MLFAPDNYEGESKVVMSFAFFILGIACYDVLSHCPLKESNYYCFIQNISVSMFKCSKIYTKFILDLSHIRMCDSENLNLNTYNIFI